MQGIYVIIVDGKKYIGGSIDIEKRIGTHIFNMFNSWKYFKTKNIIKKDTYVYWGVIEEVKDCDDIAERELFYIKKFDSVNKGLNTNYNTKITPVAKRTNKTKSTTSFKMLEKKYNKLFKKLEEVK